MSVHYAVYSLRRRWKYVISWNFANKKNDEHPRHTYALHDTKWNERVLLLLGVFVWVQCDNANEHFVAWYGGSHHCELTFCNKVIRDTDAVTEIALIAVLMVMAMPNVGIYSGHFGLVLSFIPHELMSCLDSLGATIWTCSFKKPALAWTDLVLYHQIVKYVCSVRNKKPDQVCDLTPHNDKHSNLYTFHSHVVYCCV